MAGTFKLHGANLQKVARTSWNSLAVQQYFSPWHQPLRGAAFQCEPSLLRPVRLVEGRGISLGFFRGLEPVLAFFLFIAEQLVGIFFLIVGKRAIQSAKRRCKLLHIVRVQLG